MCWEEPETGCMGLAVVVWAVRYLVAGANVWILFRCHITVSHVNENRMC